MRRFRLPAALLILGTALVLRLAYAGYGLPFNFWDPDAPLALEPAARIAASVLDGRPDLHPGTFVVGPLHIYGCAGLATLAGAASREALSSPGTLLLLGRALNLAWGLVAVAAAWGAGKRAYGPAAGLISAALLAVSPLHVRLTSLANADGAGAALVLLALYASLGLLRRGRPRDAFLAGLFTGLAWTAKYNLALVALAPLAALLYRRRDGAPGRLPAVGWLALGSLLGPAVLGACAWADLAEFRRQQAWQWSVQTGGSFEYSSRNVFHYFLSGDPIVHLPGLTNSLRSMGLLTLLGGCAGAVLALRRRQGADVVLLAFLVPFLALMSLPVFAHRAVTLVLPAAPVLLVLLAGALRAGAGRLAARWPLAELRARGPLQVLAAAAVLLAAPALWGHASLLRALSGPDSRIETAAWFDANIPPRTKILLPYLHGPPLARDRYELLRLNPGLYNLAGTAQAAARPELDRALEAGVRFVVLSGYDLDLLERRSVREAFPRYAMAWGAFYREVEARGALVFETHSPPERGPRLKVYRF